MLGIDTLNSCAGTATLFGMLKSDEELVIPYSRISMIGDDVILVDVVLK